MNKIAVVILNWNGRAMLQQFLPSVLASVRTLDATICVADNGSTDDSCAFLSANFPEVRQIVLDKNYGFAEGYNRALSKVEAEYVVLLNSDVEVTEHWLEPLQAYMDAHPEVAACQPKILSQRNKLYFEYAGAAGGFMDCYGYPFCRGRIMDVVEEDRGQYDEILPVFWATGAALFIRLSDYRKVGGLDGRFFAHMEEIDLCWRLRNRGRQLVCIPQSVVYHVGGATLKKENPKKTFLNFRNNLLMLYKNLSQNELQHVMRVRYWLDRVAMLVFFLKGDAANAKAVWQARKDFKRMRPLYTEERKRNLDATVLSSVPEQKTYSILIQKHLRMRNFFSQLPY